LGDMQHVSGLCQAADVDNFDEIFETTKIQGSGPVAEKSVKSSSKSRARVNP
jgi:hypothetical protein